MNPEERSKKHFEDAAERKHKRELERGVLRNASDMKPGKPYKKVVIHPSKDWLNVHEMHHTSGEDLPVPQGAFVELDKNGKPIDRAVLHFLETVPERIELVDID